MVDFRLFSCAISIKIASTLNTSSPTGISAVAFDKFHPPVLEAFFVHKLKSSFSWYGPPLNQWLYR